MRQALRTGKHADVVSVLGGCKVGHRFETWISHAEVQERVLEYVE